MRFELVAVFVVDDDDDDLYFIEDSIRGSGFINKIQLFNSAPAFWTFYREFLASGSPSMLILDWNMPLLGGMEILANIQKEFPDAPTFIIVLSTSNREADKQQALSNGAYTYYVKPSSVERFNSLFLEIKRLAISSGFYDERTNKQQA